MFFFLAINLSRKRNERHIPRKIRYLFIELNIHKHIVFTYKKMKIFISLLKIKVTKKNTLKSTRIKFISMKKMNINITPITKNLRTNIKSRRNKVKPWSHSQRSFMVNNIGRHPINKEDNSHDNINPATFRNIHNKT
jgi:hypothetical protein